jgi:hypothetical protein
MKTLPPTLIIKLLVFLLTLLLAWLLVPSRTKLGSPADAATEQKIVIIPSAGIPLSFLHHIETRLEEMHRVNVLVTTSMGIDPDWVISDSKQVNSNYVAHRGREIFQTLGRNSAYCIVLINEDMNHPGSGLRFIFSAEYPDGISVVSLARINPRNFGVSVNLLSIPGMFQKTAERALKLINKELGKGYYRHPISNSRASVMYGPIMSLSDLDGMGLWYE